MTAKITILHKMSVIMSYVIKVVQKIAAISQKMSVIMSHIIKVLTKMDVVMSNVVKFLSKMEVGVGRVAEFMFHGRDKSIQPITHNISISKFILQNSVVSAQQSPIVFKI